MKSNVSRPHSKARGVLTAAFGLSLAFAALSALAHKGGHAKDQAEHSHDAEDKAAQMADSAQAPAAEVYIISPKDGAEVTSPVHVQFGLRGMGIAPAGADLKNTGHHHLLIDLDELPPSGVPLPSTDQILHYGGGQTEATIELEPGKHTLQLLLGDYIHRPAENPVASEKIEITVTGKTAL